MTSAERDGCRPDDGCLTQWLYEDSHVGGVSRQGIHRRTVLLPLPGPSAQAVEAADDVEFFERTPGILPAADRRHRRAQIGHQEYVARRGFLRVQIDEDFAVADRQFNCYAVAISCQRPADGLHVAADEIVLPINDHLRRIDRGEPQGLRVSALPFDRVGQTETVPPTEVIPIVDVKREGEDVAALGQLSKVGVGGWTRTAALDVNNSTTA